MSTSPEGGAEMAAEPVVEVVEESATVAEIKKTDVMNTAKKVKNFLEDEEEEEENKKGRVKIVEFENGFSGEIHVGEGDDWVENLKDSDVWKWHGYEKFDDELTLFGRKNDEVCDQVDEDGEEIVWQGDVFDLKNIKEVSRVGGNGEAKKVMNPRESDGKI